MGLGHTKRTWAFEFASVTHRGAVRTINEDSVLAADGVFVVADGVGGSAAGELASATVTERFASLVGRRDITSEVVAETLARANDDVLALQDRDHHDAATTACGAVAIEVGEVAYWVLFNIGDSRVYLMNQAGRLTQVSVDHSHVQELIDAGLITEHQAASHPDRHVVTRAVGSSAAFKPDFWVVPIGACDRLMLCSDGLLREASIAEVASILVRRMPPRETVDNLLDLALGLGARDNVSVVVVDAQLPGENWTADEGR